jgi:hypothetical protein
VPARELGGGFALQTSDMGCLDECWVIIGLTKVSIQKPQGTLASLPTYNYLLPLCGLPVAVVP